MATGSAVKECLSDYPATTVVTITIVGVGSAAAKLIVALLSAIATAPMTAVCCWRRQAPLAAANDTLAAQTPSPNSEPASLTQAAVGSPSRTPDALLTSSLQKLAIVTAAFIQAVTPLLGFAIGAILGSVTYHFGGFHSVAIPVGLVVVLITEVTMIPPKKVVANVQQQAVLQLAPARRETVPAIVDAVLSQTEPQKPLRGPPTLDDIVIATSPLSRVQPHALVQ